MAALLRLGAGRACRLLAANAIRNPSIYQRNLAVLHKEHILKACIPRFSASRYLSSESTASEAVEETAEIERNSVTKDLKEFQNAREKRSNAPVTRYDRDKRQLGTIIVKKILLRTFESILQNEGQLTPLQAYQVIRNCGSQLLYERPEKRVELAHYMWDKIIETGTQPDETLYNALLSVYVQNSYIFNPLEVLEEMELRNVDPNRATLLLLMQGFAEKGDVEGTFKMLEYIKDSKMLLTEEVYSALVTAYGRTGDIESAKGVFDLMRENKLEPDINSYTALLVVHAEAGNVEGIMETLQEMQENKVYPNKRVFLVLLDTLSKRGHSAIMKELLEAPLVMGFVEKNLREFMITVTTRGEINTAFLLLGYMPQPTNAFGQTLVDSNERVLLRNTILSGQGMDVIMITIREMDRLGIFETKKLYEQALDFSYHARNPELSVVLLQEMLEKGIPVRNHYFFPPLAIYANRKDSKGAQDVCALMMKHGLTPDGKILKYYVESLNESSEKDIQAVITLSEGLPTTRYTITTIAQLFMMIGHLDKVEKTIELAEKEGVNLGAIAMAFEGYILSKAFDPKEAVKILEMLDKKDITATKRILERLRQTDPDSAVEDATFVKLILEAGLSHHLESQTYTLLMQQLAEFKLSQEFYELLRVMKEYEVPLTFHQYRPMLRIMAFDGKAEAAQFCFDKLKEETEPSGLDYCRLIEAYGRCPDKGIRGGLTDEKAIKKIKDLYGELSFKAVKLTKFAKGVVYTAFLRSGDVEQAEEIKSIHGEGYPVFLVTNEFIKAYAERGDVKKTLEYFERVKEISTKKDLPPFVYNQLVYCYGFHGDTDSQMKVLAEMEEKGVRKLPKTFSSVIFSFCRKSDVKSALEIFGQAKEEGPFVSQGSALRLLNTMAKTGQTEKFDSVLEDCLHHSVKAVEIPTEAREMIRGLVFACVHAGKTDLALKLMLENDVFLNANTLFKPARSAGWKGEVQALLNAIEFLKENNVSPKEMYFHLIRAHDFHRDLDAIKAVYNEVVEEGMEMSAHFHEMYNHIMIKYSERLPSSEYNQTASATQTEIDVDDESDFSSDEEGAHIQEFERETPDSEDSNKDIDEMNDPK
ncbi:unnamed protein product [Pocillopora meandrina]|uniref:PROP1-like PPR domain-containing protein n=1 Tax=Pocillopora meandrina TaxID=46732 RepID=A0AAU9XN12_9CNID|nr:unnamed protein product [Pocillopora meandrina]